MYLQTLNLVSLQHRLDWNGTQFFEALPAVSDSGEFFIHVKVYSRRRGLSSSFFFFIDEETLDIRTEQKER